MNKRQWRIERIVAVEREYLAANSASQLLREQLGANPSFGDRFGWEQKDGIAFRDNLKTTYLVRMYAEFEATLRDYWKTHLGHDTFPRMEQLVNHAIPNQQFPPDWIDNVDEVRKYRNHLVHDITDELPDDVIPFEISQAKQHMCRYVSCFDTGWK